MSMARNAFRLENAAFEIVTRRSGSGFGREPDDCRKSGPGDADVHDAGWFFCSGGLPKNSETSRSSEIIRQPLFSLPP
jgi:hypothetical protein